MADRKMSEPDQLFPAAVSDPTRRRSAAGPRWTTIARAAGLVAAVGPLAAIASSAGAAAAAPLPAVSAYATIQCEDYDEQQGIHLEAHTGGLHAGFISRGDWLRFDNVGFTATPARRLTIRAANAARQGRTGKVELRLDGVGNAPIASMTIPNNGNWLEFITYELVIPPTVGVHTVFLTFASTQDEEFANLDWVVFRQ